MSKAFAFKNFDKDRILSRAFFRSLDLPQNLTDKEILKSFDISTVEVAEKSVTELLKIRQTVKTYAAKIRRHALKLDDFKKNIANRIVESGKTEKLQSFYDRAKDLRDKYLDAADAVHSTVHNLYGRIQDRIDGAEAVIDKHYRQKFAEHLKQARKSAGITQEKLGELLGISQSGIVAYENSRREPNLSMLQRMARILEVTPNELL